MESNKQHSSYGMLSISKFSSSGSTFFGSDIVHKGGISLTISSADANTRYGIRRYSPIDAHIEIRMSYNQWVDAITSGMNTIGVPCTIVYTKEDGVITPDNFIEDRKEIFRHTMSDTMQRSITMVQSLIDKVKTLKLSKKVQEELDSELRSLTMNLQSNVPFVMDTSKSAMEDVVTEAKHSISGYIDNKIHSYGLDALRADIQAALPASSDE